MKKKWGDKVLKFYDFEVSSQIFWDPSGANPTPCDSSFPHPFLQNSGTFDSVGTKLIFQ